MIARTASTSNSTTARDVWGRHGSVLLGCAAHVNPVAVRRWAACAWHCAACRQAKAEAKAAKMAGKPDRLPPVTAQPRRKWQMVVIKLMISVRRLVWTQART